MRRWENSRFNITFIDWLIGLRCAIVRSLEAEDFPFDFKRDVQNLINQILLDALSRGYSD